MQSTGGPRLRACSPVVVLASKCGQKLIIGREDHSLYLDHVQ